MTKTAHTPESIAALNARATQGELSVFNSTLESGRFYIGTDNWAIAKSEIGATKPADFELFAALVNLYRAGRIAVLPEGIANPDVVPEAIEALRRIATVDMGGGFLGAQACRKVANEVLAKLEGRS
ncbi:MAG: hypothetical protein ACOY4P_07420 [Pseudomonadota bacterium]